MIGEGDDGSMAGEASVASGTVAGWVECDGTDVSKGACRSAHGLPEGHQVEFTKHPLERGKREAFRGTTAGPSSLTCMDRND